MKTWQVFCIFLRLGLTSFGGPIAHLGYFHTELVARRCWLNDRQYSELVALCQFLPGPASSQVGMALGLRYAGWPGLFAAWAGFTLPSALLLTAFAYGIGQAQAVADAGWIQGLKLVAVAVVAQAVWGMARTLCNDWTRRGLLLLASLLTLLLPLAVGQLLALLVTGLLGYWWLRLPADAASSLPEFAIPRRLAIAALSLFVLLLLGLPVLVIATDSSLLQLIEGVYRSGALVFGGGHVVLPLLQTALVPHGLVEQTAFLAGYGAAQAVPGPLFTFAAYLGAIAQGPLTGWLGALALLLVIFLPALLILIGVLPFWAQLRRYQAARNLMAGINAGVVGILLAALYDPIWTGSIHDLKDLGIALVLFGLLTLTRLPPLGIVLLGAVTGWLIL